MKKQNFKTALILCLALLLFAAPLYGEGDSAKKKSKRTPDPLMRLIPRDAMFCVRVNNMRETLGSMDKFAAGILPLPVKLGAFLDGENWNNVVKDGSLAIFGIVLPGQPQRNNPLANVFVGALIPVTNYNKVLRESPDLSKPDENGISRAGGGDGPLVTKAGRFALVCRANEYDKLVKAKTLLSNKSPGLRNAVGLPEFKRAAGEPVWAYANIEVVRDTFYWFIADQIEELKNKLGQMGPQQMGPMTDPGVVIDMYVEILKVLGDELQYVTVTLDPAEDALKITETIAAKEGTQFAESFVAAPRAGKGNRLMGYLEDEAMMNVVLRANSPFMSKTYIRSLDLLYLLGGMLDDEIANLKTVMADGFASMGDYLAFSFLSEEDSPFALKYVLQVKDKAKFEKSLAGEIEMMNSGAFADIYKSFGMKIDTKVECGASKYKGVSIDSAKLSFRSIDPDSDQAKMIGALYGEGFDYRWAIVGDLALYVVGGDVDSEIRALIDEVQSGRRKKISAEVKSAQELLAVKGTGDFFGTFNYVRMLKMVSAMTQGLPGGQAMPEIDIETKSNVAFTGSFRNGKLMVKSALPKQHVQELVFAFMTMQAKMAEQLKQQDKHLHIEEDGLKPLFNGKDLSGWVPSGGAKWTVKDGLLIGTQGENNAPGDLFTKKSFKDFELTCTYRVEWPCNTGIWFRYQSGQKAYQADILEYKNPVCYSGSLYCPGKMFIAMNEDKSLVDREGFNTMKVRAKGDHLQIWINGHKVADVHDDSTDSGKIGFQVHPGDQFGPMKIVVKELLIKEL